MAVKLNEKFLKGFISEDEMSKMLERAKTAHETLYNRSGAGNDYTGWVYQPDNFDREEIARIKAAAEKLTNVSYEIFGRIYQQQAAQQQAQQGGAQGAQQGNAGAGAADNGEKVYDADYEVVNDDK